MNHDRDFAKRDIEDVKLQQNRVEHVKNGPHKYRNTVERRMGLCDHNKYRNPSISAKGIWFYTTARKKRREYC